MGGLVLLMLWPLIGGVVGYFGAILLIYVQPKHYESVAVIQVHPPRAAMDSMGESFAPLPLGAGVSPRFLPTEIEVVTMEQNLMIVVGRLDLSTRWRLPPDEVLQLLREIVVATPIEGTDLVEIRVRHSVSGDARDIADALVVAYERRRLSIESTRVGRVLAALDGQIGKMEDLVDEKRKVLETIVRALGTFPRNGADGHSGPSGTEERLRRVRQRLVDLEMERKEAALEVKELLQLDSEALVSRVLGSGEAPEGLRELRRAHRVESRSLAALEESATLEGNEGLGRQRARVEVLARELQEAVLVLRNGLTTKLDVLDGRVKILRGEADKLRAASLDAALEAGEFVEAKRDLDRSVTILESMRMQRAAQRIARGIPGTAVTIHRKPRISADPVSPDVGANLTMGVVAGAAVGLMLAILTGVLRTGIGAAPPGDDEWA